MSRIGSVRAAGQILVSLLPSPAALFILPHEKKEKTKDRKRVANPHTADHVDILGRSSLNDLILQVAGGRGELIEETVHSRIREYAENVKIYEEDEDEATSWI